MFTPYCPYRSFGLCIFSGYRRNSAPLRTDSNFILRYHSPAAASSRDRSTHYSAAPAHRTTL